MGDTNCFELLCLSGAVYQVFYPEDRQSRWASDDKQITGSGLGSAAGVTDLWTSAEGTIRYNRRVLHYLNSRVLDVSLIDTSRNASHGG